VAQNITVAVDAMGGDNAPGEIVKGAVNAVKKSDRVSVILVGMKDRIEEALKGLDYPEDRVSIHDAATVIETAEHPVEAVRHKKDSSLVQAMMLVKKGEADCMISAGNSGAVVVGGQGIVGRVRGIQRPPFASLIPTKTGVMLLLDCGANVDARPEHLKQWAKLGTIYMEHVVGVKNPRVGIVNIGAEEEKGNALVKETFPLLKQMASDGEISFMGSCEARDIPAGVCDIALCDGFVGNVVLKMYEGTAKVLLKEMKTALLSGLKTKIGALLIKSSLKETLGKYDASRYGGAPILGLKALVVKMHGSAKAVEVENTIAQCLTFCDQDITGKVNEYISADHS